MRLLALTFAASLAATGVAHAQRESKLSGGQLGNLCISRDHNKAEACEAYLSGVADAIGFYQKLMPGAGGSTGKLPAYVCVPASVTGTQLRERYVTWLRAHGDAQREVAIQASMRSLKDQFGCEGENKP